MEEKRREPRGYLYMGIGSAYTWLCNYVIHGNTISGYLSLRIYSTNGARIQNEIHLDGRMAIMIDDR